MCHFLLLFSVTVVMVFVMSVFLSVHPARILSEESFKESPGSDHQVVLWPTGTDHVWVWGHHQEMVVMMVFVGTVVGDGSCSRWRLRLSLSHRPLKLSFFSSRITDQRYEKLPHFVFGDFNFRLDSKQVIEVRLFYYAIKTAWNVMFTGNYCSNIL